MNHIVKMYCQNIVMDLVSEVSSDDQGHITAVISGGCGYNCESHSRRCTVRALSCLDLAAAVSSDDQVVTQQQQAGLTDFGELHQPEISRSAM